MDNKWNFFKNSSQKNPLYTASQIDIEYLKKIMGQHFPFYDLKFSNTTAVFFCRIDEETLDEHFESLREKLSKKNFIPMLRFEKGEHLIYIVYKPPSKERPIWINIFLLIAVIITTSITGSILYMGHFDIWGPPNILDIFNLENIGMGILLFAFPLLSILFIHEMGHYFISKKHRISASLPFFIPIPPILPNFNIGTFGALISSHDPMPNKKALFDVGIAGPIAGFCIALPVTIIGILMSEIVPLSQVASGETIFGSSLLFIILTDLLLEIPSGYVVNMSLTAFAGWVGLLITSINLLPAGQLDGGHIFRAVLGKYQKYAGWAAIIIMFFTGWIFFALLIVFMMGMQHPPPLNDETKLDNNRKILFFIAVIILIICFIPDPIYLT